MCGVQVLCEHGSRVQVEAKLLFHGGDRERVTINDGYVLEADVEGEPTYDQ